MRSVIASNLVSLDGFFAGPKGELDWFVVEEEFSAYVRELLGQVDAILFGRVTYEMLAGYWPTPASAAEDPIITDAMNKLPKIVFSRTLDRVAWNNSRLAKEGPAEEISDLKRQPGKDLVLFGSGSIVAALSQLGLIDEYRIMVNPVVLGSGTRLFKGMKERLDLKLVRTKTLASGVVILYYQPMKKQHGHSAQEGPLSGSTGKPV